MDGQIPWHFPVPRKRTLLGDIPFFSLPLGFVCLRSFFDIKNHGMTHHNQIKPPPFGRMFFGNFWRQHRTSKSKMIVEGRVAFSETEKVITPLGEKKDPPKFCWLTWTCFGAEKRRFLCGNHHFPGDSSRDPFIPYLEVTNTPLIYVNSPSQKGHDRRIARCRFCVKLWGTVSVLKPSRKNNKWPSGQRDKQDLYNSYTLPRCSMYGRSTYIYHRFMPNVR